MALMTLRSGEPGAWPGNIDHKKDCAGVYVVAAALRSCHCDRPPAATAQSAVDGVMVAASTSSPLAFFGSGTLTAFWRSQRSVGAAQLQAWLPPRGQVLLDISGPQGGWAAQAAASGYAVVRVLPQLATPVE